MDSLTQAQLERLILRFKREQAVRAVSRAIRKGLLPKIATLNCVICHDPAIEYHHHLGYEEERWLDVVAMCKKCHGKNRLLPRTPKASRVKTARIPRPRVLDLEVPEALKGTLVGALIGKQNELRMVDMDFAMELKVSTTLWYKVRTGLKPVGISIFAGAVQRFSDLADVVIEELRCKYKDAD